MTDSRDPLAPLIAALKEPTSVAPDLTARVMAEIATLPSPSAIAPVPVAPTRWWRRRWTIQLSPLGGLAAAACLTALLAGSQWLGRRAGRAGESIPMVTRTAQVTQFVLVAPGAKAVAVVGDFNDWSLSATPLTAADSNGVWYVTVPLAPGRYRYAFVVDGTVWRPDPEAPAAEDDFGRPNSVVTIGGA